MAVKNSCFGPSTISDMWYDVFLGCEPFKVRKCFGQDLSREEMMHSSWVLQRKFKYIYKCVSGECGSPKE